MVAGKNRFCMSSTVPGNIPNLNILHNFPMNILNLMASSHSFSNGLLYINIYYDFIPIMVSVHF